MGAMAHPPLLRMTAAGLYCDAGGFHIDPCTAVARAVVTHAHTDHFHRQCRRYLTARPGRGVLSDRLGPAALVDTLDYGETLRMGDVIVSLHPAGHVLGSAQVRVEHRGEVWVVTGDYQRAPNPTCAPFEPIRCHHLATESTFGHPRFQWPPAEELFAAIHQWWRANQAEGKASFLYAYAFGKAQRLLAGLDRRLGPVLVTRDIDAINARYREAGVELGPAPVANDVDLEPLWRNALFVLPPAARWRQPFPFAGDYATAFASGWMLLPEQVCRWRVSQGFVLSDHADHAEILTVIAESGAETVWVMHGYIDALVAELRQQGRDARPLRSPRCTAPPAAHSQLRLSFDDAP